MIAHQSDRNQADAQIRDISKDQVQDFMDDIETIVQIIDKIARGK